MRLQAKGPPDPSHAGWGKSQRLGEMSRRPVRPARRPGRQSLLNELVHALVRDRPWTADARLVEQTINATSNEAASPLAHGLLGQADFIGDVAIGIALIAPQHDTCSQRESLRRRPSTAHALEYCALVIAQ